MVCYGPSKGCIQCRRRKIKCDERRPGCRQCEKSKKECPGYDRGSGSISFLDQTPSFSNQSQALQHSSTKSTSSSSGSRKSSPETSKGQLKQKKPARNSTSQSIVPFSKDDFGTMAVKPNTTDIILANEIIPLGLPQDPEQRALAFFMTKFANTSTAVSGEIWGGCLEALPSLLEQASIDSPLTAAATTTAMGSIAWSPGCAEFKPQSLSRYVTALNRINDAIKDPVESQTDNVLMAVLMLGFYENIKSLTLQKSARESHTKGAVALIKLRKPESFHNRPSLRLYLAVRGQILGQCIEKCDPDTFQDFLDATKGTIPNDFVPSCADRLVMLSMDLPALRFREKEMLEDIDHESKYIAAQSLLKDAQYADSRLDFWASMVPEVYQYTSYPLQAISTRGFSSTDVYPQNMDVYCDNPMASTWNTWRITRIKVLQIIMSCSDILHPPSHFMDTPEEYQGSLGTIRRLADEICSSVPFHLGHHDQPVGGVRGFAHYPHPPGEAKWPDNFAASGAVGGWLMMQPLAFTSRLTYIPQSQRDWVREYLTTFMRDSQDMTRGPVSPPIS